MATVPSEVTAVAGSVLTAAMWNSNVRDATNFLLSPPICELFQNTVQAVPNGGAALLFDVEILDTDNMHSTVSNTSRITAQTPGRYMLWGGNSWPYAANGTRGGWWLINGSLIGGTEAIVPPGASPSQTSVPMRNKTIYMNVGDYCEMLGWQSTGGSLNTNAGGSPGATFGARWIGTA